MFSFQKCTNQESPKSVYDALHRRRPPIALISFLVLHRGGGTDLPRIDGSRPPLRGSQQC